MEDSNFAKALFEQKDMFVLMLLGFTDAELVQLVDHPITFRDQGPANRLGAAIDSWLRKAALQSLSRALSDTLLEKSSAKNAHVPAHVISATGIAAVGRGRERALGGSSVAAADLLSSYAESVIGPRRASASIDSFSVAPSRVIAGGDFEKQLIQLLTIMNKSKEEKYSKHLKYQEEVRAECLKNVLQVPAQPFARRK
jgi:hypothetical protein